MIKPPIVIIGAARSGTSFLRDLLAEGEGLCAVPYDVNYVWRYGQGRSASDVLSPDPLTRDQIRFIKARLRKLAKAGEGQRIVEKTVSNTLRIGFVSKVLPDANFVYIERDGREAVASAMQQWQAKPDWAQWRKKLMGLSIDNATYVLWAAKNLAQGKGRVRIWGPRYPGIEADIGVLSLAEVCAKQWLTCCEMAREGLSEIDPARVFHISYEGLQNDSVSLEKLLDWLQIDNPAPVLDAYKQHIRKPGGFWGKLPTQDRATIERHLSYFLSDKGYI